MVFDDIIRLFACISLIVGAMECFAGFKMMKSMLAIWGLLVGTMLGVIVGVEADSLALGFVLIIIFGVALAVLSYAFYSAGIFVLTAFLTMVAVYVLCENIFIALACVYHRYSDFGSCDSYFVSLFDNGFGTECRRCCDVHFVDSYSFGGTCCSVYYCFQSRER